MLRDKTRMAEIREAWSDADCRDMVQARRSAKKLNERGIPAATGRNAERLPVIRVACDYGCGQWVDFTDLPNPFTCQPCYLEAKSVID